MKISFQWLRSFLPVEQDEEEIGAVLTDLGLEVEGISTYESVPGSLRGVVVGEVVECVPHPNADKLKLTQVNIGQEPLLQIVCGAPNVAKGQKVPVATLGTILYNGEGEPWQIKKGKIRGEVSEGMICAEDELGLGDSHDGIMVLDPSLIPGTPCSEVFAIYSDRIIEIGLTPNRSDAMSHYGVARDLRAGLIHKGIELELVFPRFTPIPINNRQEEFRVVVDAPDKAPRYAGVLIRGLKVGPSPDWLISRLQALGLKPINNVVDLTNYVMHDVGQPLHAFDLDRIAKNTIRVGQVPDGTPFVTLDGEERILHSDDLLICDGEKPLCIAGVYGGLNSGVSEQTTSIFLESAYFDPVSIRRTAKRHGLNTDASFRFERGVDVDRVHDFLCYAAALISEVAGGSVDGESWDIYPNPVCHVPFDLSFSDVRRLAGQDIPPSVIRTILESLDIRVLSEVQGVMNIQPPAYRRDVTRKVDVIEEILRVYGYNAIASSPSFSFALPPFERDLNEDLRREVSRLLSSQGFSEIMTNSLVPQNGLNTEQESEWSPVRLINPLSSELATMRTQLLPSGLQVVAHNLNRKQNDILLFEFGHTYLRNGNSFVETDRLGIWCARAGREAHWISRPRVTRFFELKGVLQSILERTGLWGAITETPMERVEGEGIAFTLRSSGKEVAYLVQVPEDTLQLYDIDTSLAYAELHWETVLTAAAEASVQFVEIPRFPEVYRDFSLLLDKKISFAALRSSIEDLKLKLIQRINLFDVFEGPELGKDRKAYGLRITFMDKDKTLTDKQIEKIVAQIVKKVETEFGAVLR